MKAALAALKRRSVAEWSVRLVLAALVAVISYGAVRHAIAMALLPQQAERAHALAPGSGQVGAALAHARLVEMMRETGGGVSSPRDRARLAEVEARARDALRRDNTAVSAAATLGLIAQFRGDTARARDWFGYAAHLSRRDLATQLWLIEDAVNREEVPEALKHYDIALRTKPASRDLLFPILAAASNEPEIATDLVKTLSGQQNWVDSFIWYVARNSSNPVATAHLFIQLEQAGVAVAPASAGALVDGLIAQGKFDAAWRFYQMRNPGSRRDRSRDPEFSQATEQESEFDWVPAPANTGLAATIQRNAGSGVFFFSAPPNAGGNLLHQVQLLPPGRYVLEGSSAGIDQPQTSRPYWVLTCRDRNRELGRVTLPNSSEDEGRFRGSFIVPTGCPVQELTLVARGSDALGGLNGEIDRAELRPER